MAASGSAMRVIFKMAWKGFVRMQDTLVLNGVLVLPQPRAEEALYQETVLFAGLPKLVAVPDWGMKAFTMASFVQA